MEYRDYYRILGVKRDASPEEIRRAYRKLAMQYHPDRNPGDRQAEERFKEINEAYQVLSDPQKRAHYDRLGESYTRWRSSGAPGDFDWSQWFMGGAPGGVRVEYRDLGDLFGGEDLFSEFFRSIFGGLGGSGTQTAPFDRASTGSAQRFGAAPFDRLRAAPRGRVAPVHEQPVTIDLQEAYSGTRRELRTDGRRIEVKIPAGVRSGSRVRVAGGGPQGNDLYLVIDVAADARFERRGNDLHTQVTVDAFTAMLGGEVEVETLGGKVILTIPAGTQPEQVFRLSGRGMPHLKNPKIKGDLYVRVKVRIPRQLSTKQKALIEEAARPKSAG